MRMHQPADQAMVGIADAAVTSIAPASTAMPSRRSGLRIASAVVALAMLAGCQVVPQNGSSPAPAPTPAPTPAPAPIQTAPQTSAPSTNLSWEVAPVARGTWRYGATQAETVATFTGLAGPTLSFRCVKASKQVSLILPGYGASRLAIIRTSAGLIDWSGVAQTAASGGGALVITRAATDPGLDSIAYSRGRVSIEPVGAQRIILPVVSEIGRVVEDCRI